MAPALLLCCLALAACDFGDFAQIFLEEGLGAQTLRSLFRRLPIDRNHPSRSKRCNNGLLFHWRQRENDLSRDVSATIFPAAPRTPLLRRANPPTIIAAYAPPRQKRKPHEARRTLIYKDFLSALCYVVPKLANKALEKQWKLPRRTRPARQRFAQSLAMARSFCP